MQRSIGSTSEAAHQFHIGVEAFKKRHSRGRLPFKPVGDLNGRLIWDLDQVRQHHQRGDQ